ncbi:MAG: zinc dependent phospholipase C family protein [Bacteroides sp.]|nr:zinc dependent phospholipase C family protein [Bacteroides sp.]MCM1548890.1 zinc dependent phospholipase C family protein [Clostridium sp.]
MPSTYAHYRFGQEVQKKLPEELVSIISHHMSLYHIGLHGPDILFYYHALFPNAVNQMGFHIHEKKASYFIRKSLHTLKGLSNPEAGLAYMLGFICHFVLDSECHSYIEFKIRQSGITHTEIETDFDRRLLQDAGKAPERTCLTSHIQPSREDCEIIAAFFPYITPRQISRSLSSMIHYNRLLLAPNKLKRFWVLLLLRLTGNYTEMHGLLMPKQARTGCEDSTRELLKRSKHAVPIAQQLCENYYNVFCEMDILSQRFHRTFGADSTEIKQYENQLKEPLSV